jgi:large conductance mechanosensitive channel
VENKFQIQLNNYLNCSLNLIKKQNFTIMGMIKEFKDFAMKGNVVDLAIGVIIGGAFGKIISSFIDDVITPLLLKPALDAAHLTKLEELTIFGTVKYGNFLSAVINFIIIAFVLFMIIKGMNAAKKKEEVAPAAPAEPSSTDKLLMEIRDSLKK